MVRSVREVFDEGQAAGRLRMPVAAWRWATGSGLVPGADVGPGRWWRAVVEADPEAVRAALRGPIGAGVAADRLTEALGAPLPILRPRVTASGIGHLVKAGLLVYLGGDPQFPDIHPDQVAALARRRDLPALLDRHVPLGPDQAAVRLGVRGDLDGGAQRFVEHFLRMWVDGAHREPSQVSRSLRERIHREASGRVSGLAARTSACGCVCAVRG
ncbi:hypothetical protein [Streptomyces virginiae]|uniref:hypothetical protein n=1 Tax=Streptomyces virginiae TaxID=1961 RepID=UPI0034405BDF